METAILDTPPKTDDIIENNETSGKIRQLERIFSEKAKANTPKKISEHSSLIKMVCTSTGMILSTYISMIINLLGVLMSNIYNTELFETSTKYVFSSVLHVRWWITHLKEMGGPSFKIENITNSLTEWDRNEFKEKLDQSYIKAMEEFVSTFFKEDET